MTVKEKLEKEFFENPQNLRYKDIEKILIYLDCTKIQAKGSHVKFKHSKLSQDIIIPVHNNECKDFYKKQASKIMKSLK